MTDDLQDRIVGTIMGVFIGDALGMGVHWQYDLDVLERTRGYVTDYLDPLPGTFHSGTWDAPAPGKKLLAGQLEQQGVIDKILLESLAEYGALNQSDFLHRFQEIILLDPTMDGTRYGGGYGWTDKSICDIYKARIVDKKPWEQCAPPRSDTPDSIVRAALIAALYFQTPREMAVQVQRHATYATGDSSIHSHAVAFASMIAAILHADLPLDNTLSNALYNQAGKSLPYSTIYSEKDFDPTYGIYSEPDSLLWFGRISKGLHDNQDFLPVKPHRGVLLYGQFCAFFASLSSAYYCAARFPDNFEDAILCSVNGGGQTTMRSSLVGALLGAKVGLQGIPTRFIQGLDDHDYLLELSQSIADAAIRGQNESDVWNWPDDKDDDQDQKDVLAKIGRHDGGKGGKVAVEAIAWNNGEIHAQFYPNYGFLQRPESAEWIPLVASFLVGISVALIVPLAYGSIRRRVGVNIRKYQQYEQIA
jgi:ADP-ribosylglycohydrolase